MKNTFEIGFGLEAYVLQFSFKVGMMIDILVHCSLMFA